MAATCVSMVRTLTNSSAAASRLVAPAAISSATLRSVPVSSRPDRAGAIRGISRLICVSSGRWPTSTARSCARRSASRDWLRALRRRWTCPRTSRLRASSRRSGGLRRGDVRRQQVLDLPHVQRCEFDHLGRPPASPAGPIIIPNVWWRLSPLNRCGRSGRLRTQPPPRRQLRTTRA